MKKCVECGIDVDSDDLYYIDDGSCREVCQSCFEDEVCVNCTGRSDCDCHCPDIAEYNYENEQNNIREWFRRRDVKSQKQESEKYMEE